MVQAPANFSALLSAATAASRRLEEEGVLSLSLPMGPLDPLLALSHLGGSNDFRFLWDGAPGLSIAAAGVCNGLELSGPRRFELAQRFSSLSLSRLALEPAPCPPLARPRVLLAFAFFESPLHPGTGAAGVKAVLPSWQLSRQGRHCWLRLQRSLGGDVTARSVAEELWDTRQRLETLALTGHTGAIAGEPVGLAHGSNWQAGYRSALDRALELVERGELQKLVLAVRQQLVLDAPLDPLRLLAHLRHSQPGSCRFLWQQSEREALVGASPERLLTLRQGQLRSDALAGTAPLGEPADDLLQSRKDRHEHELVVETITAVLQKAGLEPRRPRRPRLARHGSLVHLHTPITASLRGQAPLTLAEALHPTPAVAGLPRREAMAWLRSLEPFERGHYAAPIGWIDTEGDTDLRVAIRSGTLRGRQLELTAGAGLVRGSQPERELQEVALKLGVLQQQLNLPLAAGFSQPAGAR
ncbi:isochorismate synthase [Synechococcus sp. BA-132 BA5]|uniref:isochorismate synthase n=1 Tax=Synechococcus sp. BA-132 BA5 TaxID=3110252 RepID=UPI002B1F2D5A|nr:isochorismate synthase [Synechococcus sp. BA-132 BA5]MEA5413988.1 isochorismate synthase [Synechococcus sp. BA-132 BA5]